MRFALSLLFVLPAQLLADSFILDSAPTAVVAYPNGALVTRDVLIELPQGAHDLVFHDLPIDLSAEWLRLSVLGATLTTTQFRDRALPPQNTLDNAAIKAAKDRIKTAERALTAFDDRIAQTRLARTAAEAKIGFLSALGSNNGLGAEVATLQDLAQMVERETLAAQQVALAAERAARDLLLERAPLDDDLKDAHAVLAALNPLAEDKSQLTAVVNVAEPGAVTLSLTYPVDAGWVPVYDVTLSGQGPDAQIDLSRGALITQHSGENWHNVAVTLSTLSPADEIAPRIVYPQSRRIIDQAAIERKQMSRDQESDGVGSLGAPMIVEEAVAVAAFDGPGVAYALPTPMTIGTGVDETRVAFDTLTFNARQFARANPRANKTAFLMADFTNTTKEPLLPSDRASFYVNNTLIGFGTFPLVAAGADSDLPFGPIEDVRLSYTTLNENAGDQGFISRSNTLKKTARMVIENLGDKAWLIEIQAAVPYAVQEDLQISWSAEPAPDVIDVDDQRGVLQWNIDIPAQSSRSVDVTQQLSWPEGMILR